jgi:signal transduction histidine kinase
MTDLKKPAADGKLLVEEDLKNLHSMSVDLMNQCVKLEEDIQFYESQILRVTKIVNQMRSLSRVGGERRPVDIHGPLEESILVNKDLAEKRGISIVKEFSQNPRTESVVMCDSDEMVQVFSNLIKNAIDALEDIKSLRAPEIRLRTFVLGEKVVVQIIDNGPGVNEAIKSKLFESQVTTKPQGKGTGLGLTISRRITRAFSGDLTLIPREDGKEGAVFMIWLPRKK